VFRYLMHLVGSRVVAEDLFQETWMRVLERRHQLQNEDRFGPWLLRIARNLAFNHLRRRQNKMQVWILSNLGSFEDEPSTDLVEREPSSEPNPQERAIQSERGEILEQALSKLDFPTQEMLHLRYFETLTLAEIAEVLHTPLGTVCTKVHRGLKAVREEMRRLGYTQLDEL